MDQRQPGGRSEEEMGFSPNAWRTIIVIGGIEFIIAAVVLFVVW
jgi:hypothetical protein